MERLFFLLCDPRPCRDKKSGKCKDVLVIKDPAGKLHNLFLTHYGRVAQLDRVLASEAKGRGFESHLAHQVYLE